MASPRITKTMREGIVADVIKEQFSKDRDVLQKREEKLADRVYNEQYDKKTQKAMEELGKDFIKTAAELYVNVRGLKISLNFQGLIRMPCEKHIDTDKFERRFVNRDAGRYDSYFTPSTKLSDEVYDFVQDVESFKDRVHKAAIQLMAVLESVQSFKKLRSVWPQGEKFYAIYDVDDESKPSVPAVPATHHGRAYGAPRHRRPRTDHRRGP